MLRGEAHTLALSDRSDHGTQTRRKGKGRTAAAPPKSKRRQANAARSAAAAKPEEADRIELIGTQIKVPGTYWEWDGHRT